MGRGRLAQNLLLIGGIIVRYQVATEGPLPDQILLFDEVHELRSRLSVRQCGQISHLVI